MTSFEYKHQDGKINMYLERTSYGVTNLTFQKAEDDGEYTYTKFLGLSPDTLKGLRNVLHGFVTALEAEEDE